jgi:hypothetical protein
MGGPDFHAMFVCHKWVINCQVYPTFPMYNTKEGFGVGVGEAFALGVIMKI